MAEEVLKLVTKTIRGIDENLHLKMIVVAKLNKLNVGEVFNEAMEKYLKK